MRAKALAQLVRLKSLWGIKRDLPNHYQELSSINGKIVYSGVGIEIAHALMLGEFELMGQQGALEYFLKMDLKKLGDDDLNLFIFDFVECCLRRGENIPTTIINLIPTAKNTNIYEKWIANISAKNGDFELSELIHLSREMPLANYLKVLLLLLQYHRKKIGIEFSGEIRKKVLLLLEALDSSDRMRWKNAFQPVLEEKGDITNPLEVNAKSKEIIFGKQRVRLEKKITAFNLILALSENKELSLEKAVALVWSATYNESYYHRIRILANRINKLLVKMTAHPSAIKLTKEKIWMEIPCVIS